MATREVTVITGAFSYTGKYITRRLLALGKEVRTLTGHPTNPNPFGEQVRVFPFNFDKPAELVEEFRRCDNPLQHILDLLLARLDDL